MPAKRVARSYVFLESIHFNGSIFFSQLDLPLLLPKQHKSVSEQFTVEPYLIRSAQSAFASKASLAAFSALSIGSISWYTYFYGTLPFLGEVSANSPGEAGLHPLAYPWSHNGLFDTFDHAR